MSQHSSVISSGIGLTTYRVHDTAIGRWWQVDPEAESLYPISPYNAMGNNPVTYSDPEGDFLPVLAANVIGGGALNVASNWSNIGSFTEGLNYFVTGAAGYGVATVNPLAGGAILTGGNLLTKAAYGDLPQINSLGDALGAGTTAALDFLGPVAVGSSYLNSGFNAGGALTKAEKAIVAKEGLKPSVNAAAGTGIKSTVVDQAVKTTAAQTTNAAANATSLFRAVSKAELDDIANYGLRNLPRTGYETGKLFATSLDDAARFGRGNFGFDKLSNHIIRADVPNSVMKNAYRFTADGMKAVSIPSNQLSNIQNIYQFKFSPFVK